jgi:hypothetical protein
MNEPALPGEALTAAAKSPAMMHPTHRRPDGRPLPELHHLTRNPRGNFMIRATIDQGKFSGKRISVQLPTADIAIATLARDAAITALKKAGVLCRDVDLTDEGDIMAVCQNSPL